MLDIQKATGAAPVDNIVEGVAFVGDGVEGNIFGGERKKRRDRLTVVTGSGCRDDRW